MAHQAWPRWEHQISTEVGALTRSLPKGLHVSSNVPVMKHQRVSNWAPPSATKSGGKRKGGKRSSTCSWRADKSLACPEHREVTQLAESQVLPVCPRTHGLSQKVSVTHKGSALQTSSRRSLLSPSPLGVTMHISRSLSSEEDSLAPCPPAMPPSFSLLACSHPHLSHRHPHKRFLCKSLMSVHSSVA